MISQPRPQLLERAASKVAHFAAADRQSFAVGLGSASMFNQVPASYHPTRPLVVTPPATYHPSHPLASTPWLSSTYGFRWVLPLYLLLLPFATNSLLLAYLLATNCLSAPCPFTLLLTCLPPSYTQV